LGYLLNCCRLKLNYLLKLVYLALKDYKKRYQIFLRKLKNARIEAGLTQKEVSQLLNKPQSYVSKCESGERRIDFVELEIFAEIYGKDISYFKTEE